MIEVSRTNIAVVYLARGLPGGLDTVRTFFSSYHAHDAGIAHSLTVLVKGWETVRGLDDVTRLANIHGASLVSLQDDGFDFGAYFRAIPELTADWVCLLNTNSRIRARNWLSHLFDAASPAGVGAAGATGSWESQFRNSALAVSTVATQAIPRCVGRMAASWFRFPGFPNPHLRSNAILARKSLFKDFASKRKIPRAKGDAHILESGRIGFSAFVRAQDLRLVVCGANGAVYGPMEWPLSATFRSLGQTNLLVADNQTVHYDAETPVGQDFLEKLTWGRLIDRSPAVAYGA